MPRQQLAFTVHEYKRRLQQVQEALVAQDCDALLVYNLAAICYLTGLESIAIHKYWLCLVRQEGEPILLVQDFESHNTLLGCWVRNVETYAIVEDPVAATQRLLKAQKLDRKRLAIDIGPLSSLSTQNYLKLSDALPKVRLIDGTELVRRVAGVKSPAEIAYLREAGRISTAGMRGAIDAVQAGRTDNEIAAVAAEIMFREGSEYQCYQPIVTVGWRSGVPHSTFRRVTIEPGDPVFMEFGGCVHRYSSPMMRTAVVGKPSPKMERMFGFCKLSVDTSIELMRPGAIASDIVAGVHGAMGPLPKGWVWHGIHGYSVGLGFPPEWSDCDDVIVAAGSEVVLQPGMVFHCSTSVRDPGKLGTTCSETVLITDDGCETLTHLPRELFIR